MNEIPPNQEMTTSSDQARLQALKRQLEELSGHPEEDNQGKEELADEIADLEQKLSLS